MSNPQAGRPFGLNKWLLWFALVTMVASSFHLMLAFRAYQDRSFRESGSSSYGDLAESLATRQMLAFDRETPTATRPPLYPIFLAALFWLNGDWQAAAITQSLLAGVSLGLLATTLRFYLDKSWPVLGMLLLALYLSDIAEENIKQRETVLFSFLLISSCLAFIHLENSYRWWKVVVLGLLLGLACLVRPLAAVGLVFAVMWAGRLKLSGVSWSDLGLRLALFLSTFYLVLLPWGLRNWLSLNHFTITSTTPGVNLWKGNNPATARFYPSLDVDELNDLLETPPDEPGWWDPLRIVPTLSEVERDAYLRQVALNYITAHPDIFFQVGLVKLYSLWAPHYVPLGSGDLVWTPTGAEVTDYRPNQRLLAPYLLLYFLTLLGAIHLRHSALFWFLLTWVIFLSLIHFITFGETRFRWPINLLSLPLAGAGLYLLLNSVLKQHFKNWIRNPVFGRLNNLADQKLSVDRQKDE
jgi:4-amino-4-deoxy-L-arabinose transferase-like glycosyltransferase